MDNQVNRIGDKVQPVNNWKHAALTTNKRGEFLSATKEIVFDLIALDECMAILEHLDKSEEKKKALVSLEEIKNKIELLIRNL